MSVGLGEGGGVNSLQLPYMMCLQQAEPKILFLNFDLNLLHARSFGQICIFMRILGALIMVKWGVPEKILQNVVQTSCS